MSKPNRAERVTAFLEQSYPAWIEATRFEPIAGRCGWRTAISEARRQLRCRGSDIENRTQRKTDASGQPWILSEYRLVKPTERTKAVLPPAENVWSLQG